MGRCSKIFCQQSTSVFAHHHANDFFIMPPKSTFKNLFIRTHLEEQLRKMSLEKLTPKGLKVVECKHDMGSKNAPICYIPEQDPVQDALEKTKKTTYFKLTLPNTGNELKVAIWASGTHKQFLLHIHTAIHVFKQLGLETKEADAMMALEAAYCKLDAAKVEYAKQKAKNAKQKTKKPRKRRRLQLLKA